MNEQQSYAVKRFRDICYCTDKNLCLDLYVPQREEGFPLLVYFHGGGLDSGAKAQMSSLAEEFASSGIAFAAPDYRLYPNAEFPDYIEDAAKAVSFVFSKISEFGNCKNRFIGGHSAGAYLAMMLLFDEHYLQTEQVNFDQLSGAVLASGQVFSHNAVLRERGLSETKLVSDEAAPLNFACDRGIPLQILTAQYDLPNRREQNELLYSYLKNQGYVSEIDFQVLSGHDHISYVARNRQSKDRRAIWQAAMPFISRHCN